MSNTTFGTGNVIVGGTNNLAEGQNNTINGGNANHAEGVSNIINDGEGNHVEGIDNIIVSGFYNHVVGANHVVEGFESHVVGTGNRTSASRAGQNLSGFSGYFNYNPNLSFAADTYSYSNQLGGGMENNLYPGEGISMIDRTIINGVYPIGKHQAYLNTSDGINYAVMLKGKLNLTTGTFVTIGCKKDGDRLIKKAKNTCDVIGVITEAAGFIANAGQFPASERIQYDEFKKPLRTVRTQYPAAVTILQPGVNRATAFVPFNERLDYYTVALSGLVVVKADFDKCDKHVLKCDVKNGKAIPGNTYFIINFIDKYHLLILLK